MPTPPLYGLDIETDTAIDGLDPEVASVVSVAVVGGDVEIVVDDTDESKLLIELDHVLQRLAPGVLITWNGRSFDLPFLARRAQLAGVELDLNLSVSPHTTEQWHGHQHLDAYLVYRSDVGQTLDVSCGLKSISRLVGMDPIEVDREQIHMLSESEVREYVLSDARITRLLALRRWATASRWLPSPI